MANFQKRKREELLVAATAKGSSSPSVVVASTPSKEFEFSKPICENTSGSDSSDNTSVIMNLDGNLTLNHESCQEIKEEKDAIESCQGVKEEKDAIDPSADAINSSDDEEGIKEKKEGVNSSAEAEEKMSDPSSDESVQPGSSLSETRLSDSKNESESFDQWEPFHGSASNLTLTRVEKWYATTSTMLLLYQKYEKPPLLESKAVRRYINFPSSRLEEISGDVEELKLDTEGINVRHASTQAKMAHPVDYMFKVRVWKAATSNVLKYFKESRNPPSTHELEAVTRFIDNATSRFVRRAKAEKETMSSMRMKSSSKTSGNSNLIDV